MVHHTMNTSNTRAPRASSNNKVMTAIDGSWRGGAPAAQRGRRAPAGRALQMLRVGTWALIVGSLGACAIDPSPSPAPPPSAPAPVTDNDPLPPAQQRGKSRWTPVRWAELPGWGQDRLHEAWNAWVRGCERPVSGHTALCGEVRQLSIATPAEQQAWVVRRFQPYRVSEPDGSLSQGLLTGYYEPILPSRSE